jgi:hypothetical protein
VSQNLFYKNDFMKQRTFISLALTIGYMLFSIAAFAGRSSAGNNEKQMQSEKNIDQKMHGKQAPATHDVPSKAPHGKVHAPHSEELPHIHKFHKDRVKKMKKHHGKFWLLSKLLLALCHLSILVISYLHVAH